MSRNHVLALGAVMTAVAGFGLAGAGAASAAGVTGPAFYVDGTLYRTVATPTDLTHTGAPAHSYDTIYAFDNGQRSIATAAPGDTDYNGGRWMVHAVSFPHGWDSALASGDMDGDGMLTSDAELGAAMAAGNAVDTGVVQAFVCTVNPVPASWL